MMTLEEYDKKMAEYVTELESLIDDEDKWDEKYEKISQFQMDYMNEVLADYKKKATSEAQEYIYEALEYAVKNSQSGSSVLYVPTKEIADEIDEIIEGEIGDYMLDHPEIYEEDGEWVIDCMFGGNYVPYWDGWKD